jgi:hypothetical protein
MELNVSFPIGSGIKPKLMTIQKTQTVRDAITEIIGQNQKLGSADPYLLYVPARPAQKAKSSWNDAETPFSSLNLQPKVCFSFLFIPHLLYFTSSFRFLFRMLFISKRGLFWPG